MKYFKIEGIVECPEEETSETFFDKMDDALSKNGFTFGGGYHEVDENGDSINKKKEEI